MIFAGAGVATYPPCLNLLMLHTDWIVCLLTMAAGLFVVSALGLLIKAPCGMSSTRLTIEIFKVLRLTQFKITYNYKLHSPYKQSV